jgi:dTDP-4-amino-4,6-dideoxygalactose transaminase
VARRLAIAERYRRAAERAGRAIAPLPAGANGYRLLLRFADLAEREGARRAFAERGIEAKPPLFRPLHRYLGLADRHFPVATAAWEEGLSVPLYPSLGEEEIERVVAAIEEPVIA